MKLLVMLLIVASQSAFAAKDIVEVNTSFGKFEIELFSKKSKVSVTNFLQYVDEGFYSGTVFHRVVKNFMIQGGGFDDKLAPKKTHDPIKNEALNMLSNTYATVAMARTRQKHSAKSQFYINVKDNKQLDHHGLSAYGYAVFGKVISGMDVVLKINKVDTEENGMHKRVPLKAVYINSIKRKK